LALAQPGLESTWRLSFLFDSVNPNLDHFNTADETFFTFVGRKDSITSSFFIQQGDSRAHHAAPGCSGKLDPFSSPKLHSGFLARCLLARRTVQPGYITDPFLIYPSGVLCKGMLLF